MCIIIYKKENKTIDLDIIKSFWILNKDGAGIAYKDNNKIVIEKGFFDLDNYIEKIQENINKEIVLHMRLATHGLINEANCQPFPLSKRLIDLRKINIKTNCVFAHNGVFNFIDYDVTNSDSLLFVKNYLALIDIDYLFKSDLLEKVANYTHSRLLLWHIDYGVKLFGNWIIQDDIAYSNSGLGLTKISDTYDITNYENTYKKCYFCYNDAMYEVDGFHVCETCYKMYTK